MNKMWVAIIGILCLTAMGLMALYKGIDGQIMLSVGAIIGGIVGAVFGVKIATKGKVNNYGKDTVK